MGETLATYAGSYLDWLDKVKRVRPQTLRSYKAILNRFDVFTEGEDVDTVSPDQVIAFLVRPRKTGSMGAPATQQQERAVISQFFLYLRRLGVSKNDPMWMVPAPEVPRDDPHPVSDDVWQKLWGSRLCMDDRVWLGLGYFIGLRRYELATIAPSEVFWQSQQLRFTRKGGARCAVEYGELTKVIAAKLPHLAHGVDEWVDLLATTAKLRDGEQFLAPSSLGRSVESDCAWFNSRLQRLLLDAGLSRKEFSPHALRHSCATNLMRAGVPIQIIADQMSHRSINTTRKYMKTSGQLGLWRAELERE